MFVDELRNMVYERILYPLHKIKYGPTFGFRTINILKELKKTQWLDRKEIRAYQAKKLKRLIRHIYINVPFYSDIMHKSGIKPEDINSVEDLRYFPILTKKEIKENQDKLLSKDIGKRDIVKAFTSGTTGEPLIFYRDLNTRICMEAALLRGWSWGDYRLGQCVVNFSNEAWPSMLGKIRSRLINLYYFPAFAQEDQLKCHLHKIRLLRPFCLIGFSSNLFRIATACDKSKIEGNRIPVIFCTAEMLYDFQRDYLEKHFDGKVFDFYGCNEIGSLAFECEHKNKHITEEHVIIETTDSNGKKVMERPAEITITDLDNYAMPFIRYKNGDLGTLTRKACECKRGLGVLSKVDGRMQEFLKTSTGNYVPAIFFPVRFRSLRGIERYQIIQEDVRHITLKIVKNRFYSSVELDEMIRVIKEELGNTADIKVEECSDILLTGRGKARPVISHVPIELF
jgi:phenylacetate-CoA ligase